MDYPLARTGFWAGASGLLAALALSAPLCWWVWHGQVDGQMSGSWPMAPVAGALMVAAGALAWCRRAWARGPHRHLRWDGAGWELREADDASLCLKPPAIRVDLGRALLLRASPRQGGGACWLALERRDLPVAWHGVRVALLQRQPADPAAPGGAP